MIHWTDAFKSFLKTESGAVTIDWVVLAAATVGLALASLGAVSGGMETISSDISNQMTGQVINDEF